MRIAFIIYLLILAGSFSSKANPCNTNPKYCIADTLIKGLVMDDYGHPLSGAKISVKNSTNFVNSDEDGKFEINAIRGARLLLSYPGFDPKEIVTGADKTLIIKMVRSFLQPADTLNMLFERKDAGTNLSSVATIYTNQIKTTMAPSYAYSLAGRFPGLYTEQLRGFTNSNTTSLIESNFLGNFPTSQGLTGPNDNTEILLRLRGQTPVTIIDGVQRDIYSLDPENIESISVLKDALSTILLGVNSSRGAILITTKRPLKGSPHVSFTAQNGIQTPIGLPEPLPAYKYAYLYNEAALNEGNAPAYKYEDFEAYRTNSDPYGHPDVNWFDAIFNNQSSLSRYNLNVSGGGGAARYAVGLSYMNQEGLFGSNNPDYNTNAQVKRYTINTNIDVDVTKNFNAQLQIFAKIEDGNQPGTGTNYVISNIFNTPNNAYPVINPDGSPGGSQSYSKNLFGAISNSGYLTDYTKDVVSNLTLTYKLDRITKGLWAKAQTNLSAYASNGINRSASVPSFNFAVNPNSGDTTYSRFGSTIPQQNIFLLTYNAQYWYLQSAIGYDRQFGASHFSGKVFYDRYESIFAFDLPKTNQNMAGTAAYDFKRKYFAEAAINYGGNDRYPEGKRFGWFYAGGLGWDIAQENFIKNKSSLHWINKIKLSGTYGLTGNDNVGYFTWRPGYKGGQVSNNTFLVYPFGSSRTSENGLSQDRLANPNVSWEKANKLNLKAEIAAFNNHLQFTAEVYNNKYFDLLQKRGKQSAIIGIAYPDENIGIDRYYGSEFSLTYQNNFKDFNYFITANLSAEKSKILFMDEVDQRYPWNARTGQPVNMIYGYKADGFIQTQEEAETHATVSGYTLQPGDIKLQDLNEDGVINNFDIAPIGTTKPLTYYGITTGFSFRGLDVNVLLQGVQNRSILISDPSFGFNGKSQAYTYIIGRWTPETAGTATYPRLTPGLNANNDINPFVTGGNINSFWLHSGDYFRIKNVEIGYTIPYRFTSRLKVSAIRFFANGLNLFTYAKFNRVDPEGYGQFYPIQRVINFGINIKL